MPWEPEERCVECGNSEEDHCSEMHCPYECDCDDAAE
jgi:hypothetical protein